MDVITYLRTSFLTDLKEFMATHGSEFHNGIEDEVAINAFADYLQNKTTVNTQTPPPAPPVIMNTGDEPTPGEQPPPNQVDYNKPLPPDQQPPSTFVETKEPTPGEQPPPSNTQ